MAFRRQVKNVVRNFTDIEVKVREATSNDPWGPSSSLMSEIADATYNVTAFSNIMSMIWKRLNDHGKNWRHVYKSLTVLDYIIKTGSERVAQQCRENLFAIQTLKDFQFIDKDGKDQGINVREKSKQIVALLKDDERLKNERQRSLKAKERFAQSQGGVGNTSYKQNRKFTASYPRSSDSIDRARSTQDDSSIQTSTSWDGGKMKKTEADSHSSDGRFSSEFEKARPTNEQEEEMQLQIALAMSREEAEKKKQIEVGDETRLEMALQQSSHNNGQQKLAPPPSTLLDLTAPAPQGGNETSFDTWTSPPTVASTAQLSQPNPWSTHQQPAVQQQVASNPSYSTDPWSSNSAPKDPFANTQPNPWESTPVAPADPWNPTAVPPSIQSNLAVQPSSNMFQSSSNGFDPRADNTADVLTPNPFDMSSVGGALQDTNTDQFLGTSSKLVNLDDIAGTKVSDEKSLNPFASTIVPKTTNPFAAEKPKAKSINELRSEQTSFVSTAAPDSSSNVLLPSPLIPQTSNVQASDTSNPFLL
eukprot:gene9380-10367_t